MNYYILNKLIITRLTGGWDKDWRKCILSVTANYYSDEESITQYKDVSRGHFNAANYTQTVTFKLLISGVSVMPPALLVTSNIPDKKYSSISEKIYLTYKNICSP